MAVGVACVGGAALVLPSPAPAATVSTWSIVPSPTLSPSAPNALRGVACTGPTNCVAVGLFTGTSNSQGLIETWNGSAWSIVPSPAAPSGTYDELHGVACPGPSNCVAVGNSYDGSTNQNLIESWNGSTWSVVTSPDTSPSQDNGLSSVACTTPTSCVAVGAYSIGSLGRTLVESWDGSTWSIVTSPNTTPTQSNYLNGVTCTLSTNCVAVGIYTGTTNRQALIERWNGSTWSIVTSPNTSSTMDNELNAVSCTNVAFCVAVGDYHNGNYPTLIESWDGTAWSIVASPSMMSSDENILYGVSCTGPADCVAVGHWSDIHDTVDHTLVESWDGSAWSIVPSPNSSPTLANDLSAVTCGSTSNCTAVGNSETTGSQESLIETAPIVASGYWEVASDGGLFAFHAPFYGSMGGKTLNKPVVGMAADPSTGGYWEVASDGGLFAFHAPFYGSMGGKMLNKPIVGMAFDAATGGYWEVASDGGLFAFHAPFYGSMGGKTLNKPIVGLAALPDGSGYYEVASDGGLFAFNAPFQGSMGAKPLNKPVVGMAIDPATGGYYEVASDGGLFAFNAPFQGSMGGKVLNKPVVGMASQPDGSGYWEVAADGGLFAFNAPFLGSTGGIQLNQPVVGMATS